MRSPRAGVVRGGRGLAPPPISRLLAKNAGEGKGSQAVRYDVALPRRSYVHSLCARSRETGTCRGFRERDSTKRPQHPARAWESALRRVARRGRSHTLPSLRGVPGGRGFCVPSEDSTLSRVSRPGGGLDGRAARRRAPCEPLPRRGGLGERRMMRFDLTVTPEIVFAPGCVATLGEHAARFGRRALLVTGG